MINEPILKKKNILNRILNNQVLITCLTFILMISIIIGSSYALFSKEEVLENDVVVRSGDLEVVISNTTERIEVDYKTLGVEDSIGLTYEPYSFTIENTGENDVLYYEIRIVDKEYETSTIPHKSLNYSIQKDNGGYSNPVNLGDNRSYIAGGFNLLVGEMHRYDLKLWINTEFAEYANDKILNASLEITLYNEIPMRNSIIYDSNGGSFVSKTNINTNKVSNIIPSRDGYKFLGWTTDVNSNEVEYKFNENIKLTNGIKLYALWKFAEPLYNRVETTLTDFLSEDDGDSRFIIATNNDNINNYVWYSGKLWRVVALNNDGSVKLVTDKSVTTINYGSDSTFENSWMYQWLNEDFKDTLYNYENLLVTDYLWNATQIDGFNGIKPSNTIMVESTVGLLNNYEGFKVCENIGSSICYLDDGNYWWYLNSNTSNAMYIDSPFGLSTVSPKKYYYGVKPSINVKEGVLIGKGDGTINKPYILEGDIGGYDENNNLNSRVSGEYLKFDGVLYRIVSIEDDITKIAMDDYLKDENNEVKLLGISGRSGYFGYDVKEGGWDYYLNNDWYSNINPQYKKMITSGKWFLENNHENSYKNAICSTSNTNETVKSCVKHNKSYNNVSYNPYIGNVGLCRIGEIFCSQTKKIDDSIDIWTITHSGTTSMLWYVQPGNTVDYLPIISEKAAKPSLNLLSSVYIVGGDGTKNNPFEIAMN